jgi:predicted ribosomally synthesized peptide with SipW-like signal peptide
MNEPHEPNVTADIPPVPAKSLRASDPLGTADHVPGSASTVDSFPATPLDADADADAPASDLPAVPGYRVLREIARGGMGRVLAAHDLTLDREVALKILLPGANADRFVRESKITARLPHPGIPPVHALGTLADGSAFLAMKLIAGQTLAGEIKTTERPRLLQAFTQVCQAVGFAHSRGIIHRDLKPANIMVGAFGEVQVMDWGLAKELGDPAASAAGLSLDPAANAADSPEHTQAGAVMGTPAYMAPEQARGQPTDARADVFALGGILCIILTGQPPFRGKSTLEVIRRAGAADLADANARLDGCGADVELIALCRRCLSPSPPDRLANDLAVADELTAYLNGVQERLQAAERDRAVTLARAIEERRRRKFQFALAAAIVLLLLGGGTFGWYSDREANERRAEARIKEQQANQGVDAALSLVPDLRKQYKFEAAKKILEQAAVLAKGAAPDRLAEVEQASRDLALVRRLDDIRYRKLLPTYQEGGTFTSNARIAPPEYREAFGEHDLDLAKLDPAEAAKRIAASPVKAELIAAVDDWALFEPEPDLWERLLAIARRADPGSWTDRLRDPAVRSNREALRKLAADANPASTSAATLSVLATIMEVRGLDAAPLLAAAHADHPADFELAFRLGLWHTIHGNPNQEIAPFEAARALRPDNQVVWVCMGVALDHAGQVDEAIACLRKAVELNPNDALVQSNLGAVLIEKHDYDGAAACSRTAIKIDPKNARAHGVLGLTFQGKGQMNEAIACWRKAVELDPKFTNAQYNLGAGLNNKGQFDEAAACFNKVIELDRKNVEAYRALGTILCDVKHDYERAVAYFKEAIKLKPKDAKLQCSLGNAFQGKGQLDEAVTCYKEAIELDPKFADAHANLGAVLQNKGRLDEAIVCMRKAIEFNPNVAGYHGNLGFALQGKGQVDEAIACFKKAIELDSKLANAHYGLGTILCDNKHDYDGAVACFRNTVALEPKFANGYISLGLALYHKGQVDEAIGCYKTAIEIDPKNAYAGTCLAVAERLRELAQRLPDVIAGRLEPKTSAETCAFASFCCEPFQKRYMDAVRLYEKAFAADPKLAEDLTAGQRWCAAAAAAHTASGEGIGAPTDAAERSVQRAKALRWLRADLALCTKQLESDKPADRATVQQALRYWQQSSDLAGVRDEMALAKLPADDQKACTQLWADVAALLKKAETPTKKEDKK